MTESQLINLLEDLKKDVINREEIRHLEAETDKSPFLPGTISKEDEPADASYKSLINNIHGQPVAFLICSNPVNTELVSRNVEKSRQAGQVLNPELRSVIQTPVLEGTYETLSWALFSVKRPLADNKWHWMRQKILLAPHLSKWLTDVIRDSKRDVDERNINEALISPLMELAADQQFPSDVRKAVERTIKRLESGLLTPMFVLAHNDLWKGNVMLPGPNERGKERQKFYIIDWAGSSTKGFAFFDLVKLSRSFKYPNIYTRRIIVKHCEILGCDVDDALSYLLAAIASLGRNLEYFPRHRYVEMSVELCRRLIGILDLDIT